MAAQTGGNSHQNYYDEFKDFYIFPHEYLCLVANSQDRQANLTSIKRPIFQTKKKSVAHGAAQK